MVVFEARLGNIHFNRAIGAFQARVRVETADGQETITARAYMPEHTDAAAVADALTEVALRRQAAFCEPPPDRMT